MRLVPNRLLVRAALLFAALLALSQIVWISIGSALVLKPLTAEYAARLATTVRLAVAALSMVPAANRAGAAQRLSREVGVEIIWDDPSLPLSGDPNRGLPPNMMRRFAPDVFEVRANSHESVLWIRFESDGRPCWVVLPAHPIGLHWRLELLAWQVTAVLACIAGAYLLIARFNHQLRAVVAAARAIGQGRIPARVAVAGPEEIRELSRGFNQMSEDLQRLESDRRLMLAGISHDLGTPLTRLRLAVEIGSPALGPERALAMIQDIEQAHEILTQFLDFARNEMDEAPRPCDLTALISEACTGYRLSELNVTATLTPMQPTMLRPLAIRRLVRNLLDNAARYGGRDVEIETRRENGRLVLTVADNGPGIGAGDPHELLRPFVREDRARTKPGAGLGLAIVDRIARAHGGSVQLVNRPGGGLMVIVTLRGDSVADAH